MADVVKFKVNNVDINVRDNYGRASVARSFSTSTAYSAGDYCWYNNAVYKFATDHPSGAWIGSDATVVALGDEIGSFRDAVDSATRAVSSIGDRVTTVEDNVTAVQRDVSGAAQNIVGMNDRVQTTETILNGVEQNVTDLLERVTTVETDSIGYVDNAYVEDGVAYFTHNGEVVFEVTGIGGGGGGGSGNNAILTVTNGNDWLTKTVSDGTSVGISVIWSSLENEQPTGNGTMTIRVNNVIKSVTDVEQGTVNTDITQYLQTGLNKIRVTVADVYNNTSSIVYTVSVVSLSIRSAFNSGIIYPAGQTIEYTYTPIGAAEKTVHFLVDGTDVAQAVVTVSGRQVSQTIPSMAHGAHSLLVYFTAVIDGTTVRSNELYYDIMVVNSSSATPIITSSYRNTSATQYETLNIPYKVYDPDGLNTSVNLYANNELVATRTVDRSEQIWEYRPMDVGNLTLKIVCGSTSKEFAITVADSGIDIDAETESQVLYLTSYGRSNSEQEPSVWRYQNIVANMTGFNYVSDGWIPDADGNTALRISGSARVEIPYKAFQTDFRSTGKTIEVEFSTSNVLNYDAVIMSCMSGGRGFELTAQKAFLKSEQSEISMQFKEDEHVRVSFVVEKRTENRLIFIYINGIMSGVVQYPTDDDFSQVTPVNITLGSSYCTMNVYCIRIYDNDLTRFQILDNWIADTRNINDKLYRYTHNRVYDEYGKVVISQLPRDLPYMILSCPELPQYKGDKKTITGQYVDPSVSANSFTFTGCQINVQGTSSAPYARKNYDLQFKEGFEMSNGTHADNYA